MLSSLLVFDPTAGLTLVSLAQAASWHAATSSVIPRDEHSATLLPDGRVLVAGGYNDGAALASEELGDPGYPAARRPSIVSASFLANQRRRLTGSGYTGDSETSGGTTENTATNHPVVTLRRLDNEALFSTRPVEAFSSTQFLSKSFTGLPKGWYAVGVAVNGLPSAETLLRPRLGGGQSTLLLLLD